MEIPSLGRITACSKIQIPTIPRSHSMSILFFLFLTPLPGEISFSNKSIDLIKQLFQTQPTAANQDAQENPPEGEQPDDGRVLPKSLPELLDPQEKEDMILHVSSLPHWGHGWAASPSDAKTSCSKQLPHLLQRYS